VSSPTKERPAEKSEAYTYLASCRKAVATRGRKVAKNGRDLTFVRKGREKPSVPSSLNEKKKGGLPSRRKKKKRLRVHGYSVPERGVLNFLNPAKSKRKVGAYSERGGKKKGRIFAGHHRLEGRAWEREGSGRSSFPHKNHGDTARDQLSESQGQKSQRGGEDGFAAQEEGKSLLFLQGGS